MKLSLRFLGILVAVVSVAAKPNVLFISVDDLRVELGCYGGTSVISPNIDKLAARGTMFTRAYCQQAVCNPSRASALTGLRPSTLGIWDLPTHFRDRVPDVVTLPQHFKNNGYFTQNIGKVFHNWRQDGYQGDAPSWSVPAVMHYGTHGSDKPLVTGMIPENTVNVPRCESRELGDEAYFDGRIARDSVRALRKLARKDEPFFLAVGFWKPHLDFNAPKKYWDSLRSDGHPDAGADGSTLWVRRRLPYTTTGKFSGVSKSDRAGSRAFPTPAPCVMVTTRRPVMWTRRSAG